MVDITLQGELIWLEGEIDMASADQLRSVLMEHRTGPLILDASNLTFMDSSGLKVLVEAAASRNGSGSLVLRRPSSSVRRLLEIIAPHGVQGLEVQE
jgi:anti-sigma B factor antagonist